MLLQGESATNKELEKEVAAGRFRQDLYYRICAIPISLPPVRKRRGDISLLANHFLSLYSEESLSSVVLSRSYIDAVMRSR